MIDRYIVTNTNDAIPVDAPFAELTILNSSHLVAWQAGLTAAANKHPEAFILNEDTFEEARRYFFTT